MEDIIGDTLPFRQLTYKPIPYADFDAVCFNGDANLERQYAKGFGITSPEYARKEKTFEVTICETLKRTVKVRASSAEEAHERVEREWKDGIHILGADDFTEVHFTASERVPNKGMER